MFEIAKQTYKATVGFFAVVTLVAIAVLISLFM